MTNQRKHNSDDRSDNVEKLQAIVQNTLENMEAAEETIAHAAPEEKAKIDEKNERRKQAIVGLREEIKDEAENRKRYE